MRYDRCKFWSESSSYRINFGMRFEVETVTITKNSVSRDYALGDVWIRTNPTHRWITGLLKNALHQNHIQLERMHYAHKHPFCGSKTHLENYMGFNRNGGEASIKNISQLLREIWRIDTPRNGLRYNLIHQINRYFWRIDCIASHRIESYRSAPRCSELFRFGCEIRTVTNKNVTTRRMRPTQTPRTPQRRCWRITFNISKNRKFNF